jgi:hypothetical protein
MNEVTEMKEIFRIEKIRMCETFGSIHRVMRLSDELVHGWEDNNWF